MLLVSWEPPFHPSTLYPLLFYKSSSPDFATLLVYLIGISRSPDPNLQNHDFATCHRLAKCLADSSGCWSHPGTHIPRAVYEQPRIALTGFPFEIQVWIFEHFSLLPLAASPIIFYLD